MLQLDKFRRNPSLYRNQAKWVQREKREKREKDIFDVVNSDVENWIKKSGDEIEQLKNELEKWDISYIDLVNSSPKHTSTKKSYSSIIKFILSKSELVQHVMYKKYIPISEIEKGTNIPRKKIERARKYIIAVVIIFTGDYQYIKDYVSLE